MNLDPNIKNFPYSLVKANIYFVVNNLCMAHIYSMSCLLIIKRYKHLKMHCNSEVMKSNPDFDYPSKRKMELHCLTTKCFRSPSICRYWAVIPELRLLELRFAPRYRQLFTRGAKYSEAKNFLTHYFDRAMKYFTSTSSEQY